jgi:hypothetical protein
VDLSEVKATLIRIQALEEERDRYKKEAKRAQDDIDFAMAAMRRRVLNPEQEEMNLEVVEGEDNSR